jgi:hypothetical protein
MITGRLLARLGDPGTTKAVPSLESAEESPMLKAIRRKKRALFHLELQPLEE